MRNIIKEGVSNFVSPFQMNKARKGALILFYHAISGDGVDRLGLAVEPYDFERQVEYLARNRKIIPLTELVELISTG